MNFPYSDTLTTTLKSDGSTVVVSFQLRELSPADLAKPITVQPNYNELVVYTALKTVGGYAQQGVANECLYLWGSATATLPAADASFGYLAVDLLGVRDPKDGSALTHLDTRGLITWLMDKARNAGAHPGGIGPVHSYP
jgi:hypothetical protein